MSPSLRRSFVILALGAFAMALLLAFVPAAGHDQLWFLLMARRWHHGAILYGPEAFDSNPPLVVWLSAIPVFLGDALHAPATLIAKALVALLAGAVALFSAWLLPGIGYEADPSERPALVFAFVVLFLVVPARDLGQRDALAILLALPYVFTAAGRGRASLSLRARSAAAILAAVGFCLKPQDALIAVALEAAILLRSRRNLRSSFSSPEPAILLIAGAVYLALIRWLTPLYFTETLPILHATYWAIGGLSLGRLLAEALELTVLAGVTVFTVFRWRPVSPAVRSLCIAGAGALLAYLVQGTGWYYQQLPAIDLFGAALALHLLDLHRRKPLVPPAWLPAALTALTLLALALTTHFTGYPFTRDRAFAITSPDPAFFRDLPPGTPVAILTTSVDEAMMPVERFHLTWAQRTNNLWFMPAILRSESPSLNAAPNPRLSPATLHWLQALQHRWMLEDLERWQPALVLVERCQDPGTHCQVIEDRHDDLLAWFKRDPAFAQLWSRYSFAGTRDRFDSYILTDSNPPRPVPPKASVQWK